MIKTSECKLRDKCFEIKQKFEENKNAPKKDIVIAADTIISADGNKVFEKPQNENHAFQMLKEFSERETIEVHTSVWIAFLDPESQEISQISNTIEQTTVHFAKLSDEMIRAYIATGEPFGRAGGFSI